MCSFGGQMEVSKSSITKTVFMDFPHCLLAFRLFHLNQPSQSSCCSSQMSVLCCSPPPASINRQAVLRSGQKVTGLQVTLNKLLWKSYSKSYPLTLRLRGEVASRSHIHIPFNTIHVLTPLGEFI